MATAYAKAGQLNGAVLVAEHGEVVFSKGYGLANREWNQPNAPDTKFRLGSLTKQFTALLVMQLVRLGSRNERTGFRFGQHPAARRLHQGVPHLPASRAQRAAAGGGARQRKQ